MNRIALLSPALLAIPLALSLAGNAAAATPANAAEIATAAESAALPANTGALPDLSGVWAQKLVTSAVSNVSLIGEVISQSISINRVELDQQGRQIKLTSTPCDMRLISDQSMVKTHIPKAYVDAMDSQTRSATLKGDGGKYFLEVPGHTTILGASLDGPDAKLPTKADDPRVTDPDKDGHPGVTMSLSGFIDSKLYLVQKSWDEMSGRLLPGDRIAGEITWKTNQEILGATSRMVKSSPDSTQHPNAKQSYFRMARIDGDATCSEIVSRQKEFF